MTASTLRQAIDRLLLPDENLVTFIESRRSAGRSWRRIGNDLRDTTGIDVSYETLRSWFTETTEVAS